MLSGMPPLITASLLAILSLEVPGASAFSVAPAASLNRDLRGFVGHCPLRTSHVLGMRAPLPVLLQAQRKRGAVGVGMLLGVQSRYSPKKVLPLINGGNLVVGANGWFLEGVQDGEELFGDQAIPLELDDGQTAWILYKNGAVVLTITQVRASAATTPLSHFLPPNITRQHPPAPTLPHPPPSPPPPTPPATCVPPVHNPTQSRSPPQDEMDVVDPIEGGASASLADPIGIARSLGGDTLAGSFLLQVLPLPRLVRSGDMDTKMWSWVYPP